MLPIIAVLAFLSAAILLFWASKRRRPQLPEKRNYSPEPPPNVRPLFAPSEDDLKRDREQAEAREIAKREYLAKVDARAIVDAYLRNWREDPTRKNAVELLQVAAENGLAGDLARAADEIIDSFRKSGIDGLSASDLAALVNSHISLLSQTERSSGEIFWLKQEVARLGSEIGPTKK